VNVVSIGGGPAGLYLGILLRLADNKHQVTVYERNGPADTFGFGVVFSDATLGNLAAADPVSLHSIRQRFAHWDDIAIHHAGHVMVSTGHGFCGIERRQLLAILQERALELGVNVLFERELPSADDIENADLIQFDSQFQSSVDVRRNKFVWLGTTFPFAAFTFLFQQTDYGLFRVHAYRYSDTGSTFIVECTHSTWQQAGFDTCDEDQTIAKLESMFAGDLAGHRLIKNRSIWRSFPTIRCASWNAHNRHGIPVVLVGDAAHTAHFSIGSGTKLALEDAIALRDCLVRDPNVPNALAMYEAGRKSEVIALQAAAQSSLEWFEGTERYMNMSPAQFAYSLMTRSGRVSHQSMRKRDAALCAQIELELGGESIAGRTFEIANVFFSSRLLHADAIAKGYLIDGRQMMLPAGTSPADVRHSIQYRVGQAPWVIVEDCDDRAQSLAIARELLAAGATMVVAGASSTKGVANNGSPRIAATALADMLRNELRVPIGFVADGASLSDIEAAIAGGRADVAIFLQPRDNDQATQASAS
jgi:anthraniloyl-CoA monooxygenase